MYYKFTSLASIERVIDVFVNKRLYASNYKSLNDPMEGFYLSEINFNNRVRDLIYNQKQEIRICSFTKKVENNLMWTHYADSFKGIAIGFELSKQLENSIYAMNYEGLHNYDSMISENQNLLKIFQCKLPEWEYENEYRIIGLTQNEYVNIKPEELIFGLHVNVNIKKMFWHFISNLNQNISLKHQVRINGGIQIVEFNINEL